MRTFRFETTTGEKGLGTEQDLLDHLAALPAGESLLIDRVSDIEQVELLRQSHQLHPRLRSFLTEQIRFN